MANHYDIPKGLTVPGGRVADAAARHALTLLGGTYGNGIGGRWSKPRDCSGLIVECYLAAGGFTLPRDTYAQRDALARVGRYQDLLPGDAVFYYDPDEPSHVALYVGRTGRVGHRTYWVVQATDPAHDVEIIRMNEYVRAASYGRVRRGRRLAR